MSDPREQSDNVFTASPQILVTRASFNSTSELNAAGSNAQAMANDQEMEAEHPEVAATASASDVIVLVEGEAISEDPEQQVRQTKNVFQLS